MHIIEPADLWDRYIDPASEDRGPKGLSRHPRDLGIQMGGRVYPPENRSYTTGIMPLMAEQIDVELEEGVHLISNLVDCGPEEIEIGMAVEVVFEQVNAEITLPKFKKVS